MATYITELDVSLNDTEESYLRTQDFKQIYVNLNMNGSPEVYLWYKEGSKGPITRIQFSFTDSMAEGLNASGYEKVKKNLNTGSCGDNVLLWYFKGTTESHVPIKEIEVSRDDEARKFSLDWERMSCNLNRGTGESWAFLWVKREKKTYIQDMKVTDGCDNDQDYLEKGYIRVDESTNRSTSGKPVFLWYLPTIKMEGCYVSLKLSTNDKDCQRYQKEGFLQLTPPVNLNEGNRGNKVYLWYKKEDPGHKAIQTITLLSNQKLIDDYMKAGVTVLQENLNSGCGCPCFPATPLFLGYYN